MPRAMRFAVDDVLAKAIDRFSIHGYHGTSVGDLEDCMGIHRASMYNTFGSKRGLFVRALRFYIESYDRSLQELLDRSSSHAGAIIDVFEEAAGNGCFVVNVGLELASHDAEIARIVTDFYGTTEHRFRMLIEQGQSAGEIAASIDPLQTANGLFGMLVGLWALVRSGASRKLVLRAAAQQVLALTSAPQPGGVKRKRSKSRITDSERYHHLAQRQPARSRRAQGAKWSGHQMLYAGRRQGGSLQRQLSPGLLVESSSVVPLVLKPRTEVRGDMTFGPLKESKK